MSSSTEICNMALVLLGQEPILTLDDSTKSSRLCSRLYTPVLEALLRAYPWTFAIKRVVLAKEVSPSVFGGLSQFPLPSDYLRMVSLSILGEYAIEGNKILTDETDRVDIRYVARVTDPNLFDAQFTQVLIYKLAAYMCISLTADQDLYTKLQQVYLRELMFAQNSQAIEACPQSVVEGQWLPSRY